MPHRRTDGGATGTLGRRLRRVTGRPRRSVAETQLVAGLAAVAATLGLGGVVVLVDAPAADRAEVQTALRDAPLDTLGLALAGGTVVNGPPLLPAGTVAGDVQAPPGPGPEPVSAGERDDGLVIERSSGFSPAALSIPAIGLSTGVGTTGMTDGGNLEVPDDPQRVGWYRGFSEPGDPGVSVLLGHVDSREGPGVFFDLPDLEAGAEVTVERSDGREVAYVVERMDWYPKDAFPTREVSTSDRPEVLRLITCGGAFDRDQRTYLENVVVTAVPVDAEPAPEDGRSDDEAAPDGGPSGDDPARDG